MSGKALTAVAAAADLSVCETLPSLLAAADVALAAMACDGPSAMEALVRCRPNLAVIDAQLPGTDGFSLAERICTAGNLPVRPGILLLCRQEFLTPKRAKLESMGAAILPWPADKTSFKSAVNRLLERKEAFSGEELRRADALLDVLGFPAHAGRDALRLAALVCARDERLIRGRSKTLYPMVGKMMNLSSAGVERAIRSAIGAAWQSDKFENQHRIFADTVDAGRGQPSCGEMIAHLADILRLEG